MSGDTWNGLGVAAASEVLVEESLERARLATRQTKRRLTDEDGHGRAVARVGEHGRVEVVLATGGVREATDLRVEVRTRLDACMRVSVSRSCLLLSVLAHFLFPWATLFASLSLGKVGLLNEEPAKIGSY